MNVDVDPGSLIEKAARGMRHVKRAIRGDLHRFKAFIEMQELETGAWRGVIEDGEVVEEHDPSYDEERDYSDVEDLQAEGDEQDEDEDARRGRAGGRGAPRPRRPTSRRTRKRKSKRRSPSPHGRSAPAARVPRAGAPSNGGSPSRSKRTRSRA